MLYLKLTVPSIRFRASQHSGKPSMGSRGVGHDWSDLAAAAVAAADSSVGKESACNAWIRKICWKRDRLSTPVFLGFPCGAAGKESACNAGDLDLIPGLGRSPVEGKCYLVFWPGVFHGLYSPWGHKELDMTKILSLSGYHSGSYILLYPHHSIIVITITFFQSPKMSWFGL